MAMMMAAPGRVLPVSIRGPALLLAAGLALALLAAPAGAEGFLGGARSGRQAVRLGLQARSEELQAAMGAILGCGSDDGAGQKLQERQAAAKEALLPIWRTLPKNVYGRVEWRLLRYMAHRHFMQQYSFLVRGFEPMRRVNTSDAGSAEILSQEVPALASLMLDGARQHGVSLEDAAVMVAAVEQLILSSDETTLEASYKFFSYSVRNRLNRKQLSAVLKHWMVHWMLGEDEEGARMLAANESMLEETVPHWREIASMVEGSIRSAEFARRSPGAALDFGDALNIVADISRRFSSYWETECQIIKDSLIQMDPKATGRVRLTDFYSANMDGEWRFGESEAYLRELGALDETSLWRGTQVIIPNYMQGASNCIVSRPHYLVCCVNECEDILSDVEAAVGEPLAPPEVILDLVGNMTNYADDPAPLDDTLRSQLRHIAQTHGGKVPLHGRLFAQWLHYVFPRECAFPHKAGAVSATTPTQFGDDYMVSEEEVNRHIAEKKVEEDLKRSKRQGSGSNKKNGNKAEEPVQDPTQQWMTQWSEEEELPGDYTLELSPPWQRSSHTLAAGGAVAASAAAVVGLLWASGSKDRSFAPMAGGISPAAFGGSGGGGMAQAQGGGGAAAAPVRTHFV